MINVDVDGTTLPCPSGPSDDNWASKFVALMQALAATTNVADWTALTLAGNWTNDDEPAGITAGFYVDRSRCYLRGSPANVVNFNASTPLCTLPLAARPAHQVTLSVPVFADGTGVPYDVVALGSITIGTNGVVTWGGQASGANTAIVLDGLSFPLF